MEEKIRLNKYLSEIGFCSRREADRLVEAGKVKINGHLALMGDKVSKEDTIEVNGNVVTKPKKEKMVLIAVNKPRGIVCTTTKQEKDNIVDFVKYPTRIYPIGRLDKDSEGLILMTNNGELVNKILRSRNNHEKEYIVTVNKQVTSSFLKKMEAGVPILDTITKPCVCQKIGNREFKITITQGLNRQIGRMCEHFGYREEKLVRNIRLGNIPKGHYRNVTKAELEELQRLLDGSEE